MYRNKSAISLRSLAHSVKQSIAMDLTRGKSRQFVPLRSSSSTMNLANNKSCMKWKNNIDEQYLIMLDTRKSKFGSKSIVNRESNATADMMPYNVKSTRQLFQRKQKLSSMTRRQLNVNIPWHSGAHAVAYDDQIMLTLQLLEKQYMKTKQSYQQNFLTTTPAQKHKNHNKLLQDSDKLTKQLNQITAKQNQFIQHKKELQNRIYFLNEEILSIEMNFAEDLAEKQYCEEFLYQYQNAQQNHFFKEEAQHVMKLILLQEQNSKILKDKSQIEITLQQLENDFKEWKIQQNLQLKQRRFQNKFKEHRIELMKIEQDLDHITQQIIGKAEKQVSFDHSIRKVRQYICSYFKKYNLLNINHISHGEIADGIDIFLCKEGLIKDFTKFLKEKTEKESLSNGTYSLKLTQYCDCLKKIQNLFSLQKTQINSVLTRKFEQKIIALKQKLQTITNQKQKNLSQIKDLESNIEIVLAQESLSMIQLINKGENSQLLFNKKQGFFNLQQIKAKVKEMKIQQIKRINRVKEIYFRLKKLQSKQISHKDIQILQQQKQLLKKEITVWNKKIQEIQSIRKGYESKKQKCDQLIDQAITKMKQKDKTEKTLKALECEIQQLKKQKIEKIKSKHMQNKSLDLLGCLKTNILRKEILPRKDFFDQTKKFLTDRFTINPKIETLRSATSRENDQRSQEKASAQFCIRKNQQTLLNDEKMSNKTQSSPKSSKERISLGALNSIILSKCNLVESKNVTRNNKKSLKKSESMFGFETERKLNEQHKKQSFHKPIQQNIKSLKKLNKQNISRKTSISKNTQRSTIKHGLKSTLPIKLNLQETKRITQAARLQQNYSNNFPKSKFKASQTKASKKDINSIISNKLLRR